MALRIKDRVKQGTTTTGAGTINLDVSFSSSGFQDFSSLGNGTQTYYAIEEGSNFEIGLGTYNSNTLTRSTVLDSSNGGAKISLNGNANVFVTYPADKAVFTDADNNATVTGLIVGQTGVKFNDGTIQTTAFDGSVGGYDFTVSDGSSSEVISSGNTVVWTGVGNTTVSYSAGNNTFSISGADQDLSSYATQTYVNNASGYLQTQITNNDSDISTLTTNLAATGQTNANSIASNSTDISTVSGLTVTNANNISSNDADISTVSGLTVTNSTNISSNTSDISTVSGLTVTNANNISSNDTDINTVSGLTVTNATDISNNSTNIGTVSGLTVTNASSISANSTNIGIVSGLTVTNANNISTNSTDIDTVSGIAAGKDNYQYWTITDGSNSENIQSTNTVKFTGEGNTTVSYDTGSNTISISGSSAGGGGGGYDFTVSDGSNSEVVASGDSVTWTGTGATTVSYNTGSNTFTINTPSSEAGYEGWTATDGNATSEIANGNDVKITGAGNVTVTFVSGTPNVFTVSGADQDLSSYATQAYVGGVSGHLQSQIDTNSTSISTNSTNINTVSGLTVTNATNISTNSTNIASTGATNAAAAATNATDISTVSGLTVTNANDIDTVSGLTVTNGNNISTNSTNINTVSGLTVTNGNNISTNSTNIGTVSGLTVTNANNISTNSTNIDTVSGLLYTSWTVTDGSNSEAIAGGEQVKFTGGGNTTVSYDTSNNTVTISGNDVSNTYVAGSGLKEDPSKTFNVQTDNSTLEVNSDIVRIKDGGVTNAKLQNSSLTVNAGTGLSNGGAVSLGSSITIDADTASTSQVGVVQLQDSASDGTTDKAITPNAVYDISGVLQTNIDAKDNYTKWVLSDNSSTTNVDSDEQVTFIGAGGTTISLGGTDNRSVTITSTDNNTEYTAGTGLILVGDTEFNVSGIDSSMIVNGSVTNDDLAGSITNAKLANSSITVTAGDALTGGGSVALGGSVSLAVGVDNSSIEINSDEVRVKAGGVTAAMLNTDVTLDEITDHGATTTNNITVGMINTSGVRTPISSGAGGATATFDLGIASTFTHTLAANSTTTLAVSNVTDGQKFMIRLEQNSGGTGLVNFFSNIRWAGGTPPTLTATVSKVDTFGFLTTTSGNYEGFIIGQNI